MGCDIHVRAEIEINGHWYPAEYPVPDDRNYVLFAVLGDVRNAWGIEPIAEPRGLPDDLCPAWAEIPGDYGVGIWWGDHSFSYLTLAEIRSYRWSQTIRLQRVEKLENYVPNMPPVDDWYASAIGGPGIVTIQEDQVDGYVPAPGEKTYVSMTWPAIIGEECEEFVMWAERIRTEPDRFRIVFGFDS